MASALDEQTKATTAKASEDEGVHIDPDEGFVETRSIQRQWIEFILTCLCMVAWTIDAAILPLFFTELQELFGVTQTQLGMLSTAKGWTAAAFGFPCGFMGELLPRPLLVGVGMLIWSSGLAVCAMASSFEMLFLGRVFNGIGLGIVNPLLLSLVADKNAPTKRGSAFGSIYFTGAVCNTLFGFVATTYAATQFAGIPGWRWSTGAVALFSAVVGVAILLVIEEPNAPYLEERRRQQGFLSVFRTNMPKIVQLFRYPTFVLILCQGAPGTAPWTVFPYFTQWLELSCFTHAQSALIMSAFGWGGAFSSLLTGFLLNLTARRFPNHGPPTLANFSVAIGIPFLCLFFFILPRPIALGTGSGDVPAFVIAFLTFGLGASMCGTINKKIFADIVPSNIYTYVFAMDNLIEQGLGNFAGLAVGVITDKVFKYDASAVHSGGCAAEEAGKLGKGMFYVCLVGWTICFSVYLGMHCTYPKDRRAQLLLRHAKAVQMELTDGSESKVEA